MNFHQLILVGFLIGLTATCFAQDLSLKVIKNGDDKTVKVIDLGKKVAVTQWSSKVCYEGRIERIEATALTVAGTTIPFDEIMYLKVGWKKYPIHAIPGTYQIKSFEHKFQGRGVKIKE